MRKIVSAIVVVFLLTACSQIKHTITDETKEILELAIDDAIQEANYTEVVDMSIKIEIKNQGSIEMKTAIELKKNAQENKFESQAKMNVSLTDIGEQNLEAWYKDGIIYLNQDGVLSASEESVDNYLNQFVKIDSSTVFETLDLESGKEVKTRNMTVVEFELSEEGLSEISNSLKETFGDASYNLKSSKLAFAINEEGKIQEKKELIELEMVEGELIANYIIDIQSEIKDIGTTVVEYPDNLESFTGVQEDAVSNKEILKNNLIEKLGYQEISPNVISFDWGSEIYQFDFNENEFSLIIDENIYSYNWGELKGKANENCVYDFDEKSSENCTDEQSKNIQLAQELFSQECSEVELSAFSKE